MAEDTVRLHRVDAHEQGSVIDHEGVSCGDITHEAVIVHGGGKRHTRIDAIFSKLDDVALEEIEGSFQITGADGRAGEIEKHRDVDPACFGLAADPLGHFSGPFVFGVAHVEPENVGALVNEASDHFFRFGRWA